MMNIKKYISLFLVSVLVVLSFVGCSKKEDEKSIQLQVLESNKPVEGQTLATIKVKDFGEIKFVLFNKVAPKGVQNFVTHAKNGYYDGVTFHRVIKDFMIQGGDPKGDGTGGESIWGNEFEVEVDIGYRHYNGALSYANAGGWNSSQFFIVNNTNKPTAQEMEYANALNEYNRKPFLFPEDITNNYIKYGGTPHLDGDYTVFGQIYEGLDIVDKIMGIEVGADSRGEMSVPKQPVIIETITITEP